MSLTIPGAAPLPVAPGAVALSSRSVGNEAPVRRTAEA